MVRRRVPRPAGATPASARPRAGGARRAPFLDALARLPRPRLTGLGCGVLASASMVVAAWFCEVIGGAPTLYGVLFVLTALVAAGWVRPAELVCGPIAAPIAFALGLLTTSGPMNTVTELALRAPWLFAGTAVAVWIAVVRKGLQVLRRRLRRSR
ncbi:hypothetical protein FH609_016350 [Streptomyces sp. 3MP-14]|uniref:DUF6542 domain-containing protein n=1 Tax=Streptomyces mimosae TaxID=2586635 RepID=A0A5N6AAV6_9ACTN|nr:MULTISPECIES: DUF6542 domain-containing protein [Streptomyces]KAB8165163.1 hypothetical protein FH607_013675 [Streptomyces mimosae]KAB8175795.1 hypothetical protein FH609_016350 [Streptomyces sp. 3MP-14]